MPPPPKDGRYVPLYAPLRRRMIENGDWDRIRARLARELNETGYIDRYRDRSKEMARSDEVSVERLLGKLLPQAEVDVPVAIRQEIVESIRKLLERQIEFS